MKTKQIYVSLMTSAILLSAVTPIIVNADVISLTGQQSKFLIDKLQTLMYKDNLNPMFLLRITSMF